MLQQHCAVQQLYTVKCTYILVVFRIHETIISAVMSETSEIFVSNTLENQT